MYNLTVKIDGIESRRRSAGVLHILIGFFLIAKSTDYYRLSGYTRFWPVVPVLLVASFSLFYGFFRRKLDLTARYNFWMRVVQLACFLLLGFLLIETGRSIDYAGVFVFALLSVVLLISERRIFQETTIVIDNAGVHIPGYYRNHVISWNELSDVVVREDYLTLFHRKQKYLQYQVLQDLSVLELAKMNAFCRERLEAVPTLQTDDRN